MEYMHLECSSSSRNGRKGGIQNRSKERQKSDMHLGRTPCKCQSRMQQETTRGGVRMKMERNKRGMDVHRDCSSGTTDPS